MAERWTIWPCLVHGPRVGAYCDRCRGSAGPPVVVVPLSRAEKAEAERDELREVAEELARALRDVGSFAVLAGRRWGALRKDSADG